MHAESLPVVVRSTNPVMWQPESTIWEEGTPIWRTSKEWIASGPRGWNADFALYET